MHRTLAIVLFGLGLGLLVLSWVPAQAAHPQYRLSQPAQAAEAGLDWPGLTTWHPSREVACQENGAAWSGYLASIVPGYTFAPDYYYVYYDYPPGVWCFITKKPGDRVYLIGYQIPGVPDTCTISLSGFPTEVEPGNKAENLQAKVTCTGRSPQGIAVTITPDVTAFTGGHQHDTGRRPAHAGAVGFTGPTGGVTDANGLVSFTFTAPALAGDHTITAKCADGSCGEDTGKAWVGVKDLRDIPDGPYTLTGSDGNSVGWTPTHRSNHYLILDAAAKLRELGYWYSTVAFPFNTRLQINDASLERGGIFDINNNWKRPHREHCRGTVVDIRANGGDGALNIRNRSDPMIDEIKSLASGRGIDAVWEVPVDQDNNELWNLRHFHVRLLGQEGLQCPW